MMSLRLRLALILLAVGALLLAAAGLGIQHMAHREVDALFDAQLVESARSMLAQYAHDYDADEDHDEGRPGQEGDEDAGPLEVAPYRQELRVFVRDEDGRVLYRSQAGEPIGPLTTGFHEEGTGDDAWRAYTVSDDEGELWVTAAQRHGARSALTRAIAWRLHIPLFVLVPAMALLMWFGVGAGLAPLRNLAASVARRTPERLEPIEDRVPGEVRPLVAEINGLLARLKAALSAERRFTADASHELRTPLAALKTHAQVGLAATNDADRRRALENVSQGADRAARLVEQLLLLARMEPGLAAAQSVDLRALASLAVGDAASRGGAEADVGLVPGPAAVVRGDAVLLGVLLRNLIDNAVRYGGGKADVAVREEAGAAVLEVSDEGPGIPPELRARVFDRFYRGLGHEAPGSGLGLSIVARIAELHGGRIELTEGPGGRGLTVRVRLPAAAA